MPSAAEVYLERIWLMLQGMFGGGVMPVINIAEPISLEDGGATVGIANPLHVTSVITTSPVPTSENWRVMITSNVIADNSNKTFTVPANREWQILRVFVKYSSTATVGNRQVGYRMETAGGVTIARYLASVVQAASLVRYYQFAPGCADLLGFRDTDMLNINIGVGELMSATQVLRVWDNKAIAAAADDMDVHLLYAERTV
jgi:hypothetical protein